MASDNYDVIKWEHFPRYWPRSPMDSPNKGPVTRNFDVFFDLCSLWRHCNAPSMERKSSVPQNEGKTGF